MMNPKDISQSKNKDLAGSLIAMKRAALAAREIAIATNTAIIIQRDQQIVRVSAEELRRELHSQALEAGSSKAS